MGQLAVDLLISQSGAKRCAILESPDVLPIAGHCVYAAPPPDSHSTSASAISVVTSLELHCCKTDSGWCYMLQQRGPVATGRQVAFSESLVDWIVNSGFSSVLLLGSVDAGFRNDRQLQGPPICAVSNNCPQVDGVPVAPVADLGTKPLEERKVAPWYAPTHAWMCVSEASLTLTSLARIPGSPPVRPHWRHWCLLAGVRVPTYTWR